MIIRRLLTLVMAAAGVLASSQAHACDGATNRWVGGAASYWHGTLGRTDFCNISSVGASAQRASDCAWRYTEGHFGSPPDKICAKTAIETSPQGKADLDAFVAKWAVASGLDCSASSIAQFFPYWHGALGRGDYCNNSSIGPDRAAARECAFQALVRDKGVAVNSCLRDAIANSPQGKADLDDFVSKWTIASGLGCSASSIAQFFPHWHGALGQANYCNNPSIGPDRAAARECAFQALVRDKGVAANSCLRDAIADSPQGKADLDDFVRLWTARQSLRPAGTISADMSSQLPTDVESCDASKALEGYYPPPLAALDWTPTIPDDYQITVGGVPLPANLVFDARKNAANGSGGNEGRLSSVLREAAKTANPSENLCRSAAAFGRGDPVLGNALADLSVTGRRSFARFRDKPLTDQNIIGCAPNAADVGSALDRAYSVANVIRFPDTASRARLGWIAVSGEDDQPHRPVNVPSAEFPQYDLTVTVPVRSYDGRAAPPPISVSTRYMIASPKLDRPALPRPDDSRRLIDDQAPTLEPGTQVILFIHGMDSRLEEALDLTHALHRIGARTNKDYTVVAMDLPTSGYAENLDHTRISTLETIGVAKFRPVGASGVDLTSAQVFDAGLSNNAPVSDFTEDFIVAFVKTLDARLPGLKKQIRAVVGGSLGGNMVMRLGRRGDEKWIRNVVPWSPAAIWPSFAEGANPLDHIAVAVPLLWAGGDARAVAETDVMRRLFFFYGFDWRFGVLNRRPQAEEWYRDGWSCKPAHMFGARLDRQETYDQKFRLWHWRLAAEQLSFSQQLVQPDTHQPLYMQNATRMLLICGYDDTGGHLCEHTQDVASRMTATPGKAVFLRDTGHSIHNERPNWLAQNIIDFIK